LFVATDKILWAQRINDETLVKDERDEYKAINFIKLIPQIWKLMFTLSIISELIINLFFDNRFDDINR